MKPQIFTWVLTFFLLLTGAFSAAVAQSEAAKFGKIDESELKMRVYENDTSAAAVVLSDYGYSHFMFSNGIKLIIERHVRIKILKKSGYEWANVEIPLQKSGSSKETANSIKGFSYNLENGKIVKDKLESKAIFDEKINENWSQKKFTMPNVKEGTVIEYSYTITSDFIFTMKDWEFQTTIPTVWSEFRAQIPEYFDYKFQLMGYHAPFETKKDRQATATPELVNNAYRWVMKDLPALKEERFITTIDDYKSKIEFELQTVSIPGEMTRTISGGWDDIQRNLFKHDNFGIQLNRTGFFKNELAAISAKFTAPEQKMEAIYELVKSTVKWNEKYGIYTTTTLRKAFDTRTGNVADINLLLLSMLREAGFDAAPVIVSTRQHGRPFGGAPLISKFNYVITHVKLGESTYLLDATAPLMPMGMLPFRALNSDGYLLKDNLSSSIPLKPMKGYTTFFKGDLIIDKSGEMKGKVSESHSGYSALSLRERIKEDGESTYLDNFKKEIGDFKIDSPAIANLNKIADVLSIGYSLTASGNGQQNSVLYVNPMLGKGEKENPFRLEERSYPVDFGYSMDETYMCSFIIPDGYELDEAPKNLVLSLPENGGKFTYVIQKEGNAVQVLSKITLSKPVYYAQEYQYLKEFYAQIVAKHGEQLVLKAQQGH